MEEEAVVPFMLWDLKRQELVREFSAFAEEVEGEGHRFRGAVASERAGDHRRLREGRGWRVGSRDRQAAAGVGTARPVRDAARLDVRWPGGCSGEG